MIGYCCTEVEKVITDREKSCEISHIFLSNTKTHAVFFPNKLRAGEQFYTFVKIIVKNLTITAILIMELTHPGIGSKNFRLRHRGTNQRCHLKKVS